MVEERLSAELRGEGVFMGEHSLSFANHVAARDVRAPRYERLPRQGSLLTMAALPG